MVLRGWKVRIGTQASQTVKAISQGFDWCGNWSPNGVGTIGSSKPTQT